MLSEDSITLSKILQMTMQKGKSVPIELSEEISLTIIN